MIDQNHNISLLNWRSFDEFDGHEFVIGLSDEAAGLKAYVSVHSTQLGPALGGTRMLAYASEAEALHDVLNLSRAMTYKCALAHLPYGGGKAVIIGDASQDRTQLLTAYGRLIEQLRGLFKTGTDVGVSDADVRLMATQTSHMLGVSEADRGDLSTSKVAAIGVFYAMKAALDQLGFKDGFHGASVAVKGVGKLGAELVRMIVEAGGEVVVADVDDEKCQALQRQYLSVKIVPVEHIHEQEVTVYAPCALGKDLTRENIGKLRCQAVVGGANNQLADSSIGLLLTERNILYAPDYVANAGGLIYVADELEAGGFNKERVIERTKRIEDTMKFIFDEAVKRRVPTDQVADELANARIAEGSNG